MVLDPVFSLRQRIRLVPGASVRLTFSTGAASDRATAEALAQKYRDPSAASRTFALAYTSAQSGFRHLGISHDEAILFERLASKVFFTDGTLRARPETIAENTLGQAGLWPHGISGDLPMLLVRVTGEDDVGLVRQVLQAQEYWRLKGLNADLVILNEHPTSYLDEMQAQLTAVLDNGPWRLWKHRSGGAYLLRADWIGKRDCTLIAAAARAVLAGDRGDLRTQLDTPHPVHNLRRPAFAAVPLESSTGSGATAVPPMPQPQSIARQRAGRLHGPGSRLRSFSKAIRKPAAVVERIIANASFGTVVTASGSAHTWSRNSRENRLTSFANDPIVDPTAEALFVRDDDSGDVWSPTPGPMVRRETSGRFVVEHSAGVTRFSRVTRQISHELAVFVDIDDPVKFSLLTLTNDGDSSRTLSLFAYNDWVLGPPRESQSGHIKTTCYDRRAHFRAKLRIATMTERSVAHAGVCPRQVPPPFIGRNA